MILRTIVLSPTSRHAVLDLGDQGEVFCFTALDPKPELKRHAGAVIVEVCNDEIAELRKKIERLERTVNAAVAAMHAEASAEAVKRSLRSHS